MDKNELRKLMLQKRKILSAEHVRTASSALIEILKKLPVLQKSNLIFSYMSYGSEVDLLPLNRWILDQGKSLCIPRVLNGWEMDAVMVEDLEKNLSKSGFGILEPDKESPSADITDIDLILVPGLAFDKNGNRLGHGKGYYDRFLERCGGDTYTIGISYECQFFDHIPYDIHDVRLNALVTEAGFYPTEKIIDCSDL